MFRPLLSPECQRGFRTGIHGSDSRVVEYIDWYFITGLIQGFLNVEGPQESRHGQKCPLFRQTLATADTSAPAKRHVTLIIGKWPMQGIIFEESLGIEAVWFWEFLFAAVNRPDVTLDPGVFGNVPSLYRFREEYPLMKVHIPCNNHPGWEHVADRLL